MSILTEEERRSLTDHERTFADSMKGSTYIAGQCRSFLGRTGLQPSATDKLRFAREGASAYARHSLTQDASAPTNAANRAMRDLARREHYL